MRRLTRLRRRAARTLRSAAVAATGVSVVAASALAYADGIDISHYQGTVSWSRVDNAGISFAFMKATEGSTYADPTLRRNWDGAEAQGIYRGAYHFARPSSGTAAKQARYYVSKVGSFTSKGDLPPVLDLEATGGLGVSALRTWVSTWLSTTEKLTGRTPIIYVSPSFWEDHLGNSTAFHHYPLWVAHYGVSKPRVPGGWSTWTFWQRTSSGSVPGISGNVDMNEFNGSSASLAKLANTSGGSTTPPAAGPVVPTGIATAVTLTPGTTKPAVGHVVHFKGTLTRLTASTPLAAKAVSLWSRPSGSTTWTRVATGTTTSTGTYNLAATVSRTADYQVRWLGGTTYAATVSPTVRVTAVLTATGLDLHKDKASPRRGAALMLYGHLTAGGEGLARMPVRYYKRAVHGTRWIYVGGSTSVAPTGWHSIVVHPKIARVWKVVYAGNSVYAKTRSSYLTVRPR